MKVETFNEFFFASIFYSIDYIKQQQQQKTAQHSLWQNAILKNIAVLKIS